jgi:release factor glutamine methyltransferase
VRDRFRGAGLATPELDARLLAELAFGLRGIELVTREREPAPTAGLRLLDAYAERRLSGEPVARIVGEREFYGLPFGLVPETLVPRPETEMLVDFALERLPPARLARILDLGTGTGCIVIAVLGNRPLATGVAIDLSGAAAVCAVANASRNGVERRLDVRVGAWFAPLRPNERFDLILSNPPYIESAEIDGLAPEVREHDPRLALDGGPDGLAPYREIAAGAAAFLAPGGWLVLEIGSGQGPAVAALLETQGLVEVAVKKDLAGLDRMVVAHHVSLNAVRGQNRAD